MFGAWSTSVSCTRPHQNEHQTNCNPDQWTALLKSCFFLFLDCCFFMSSTDSATYSAGFEWTTNMFVNKKVIVKSLKILIYCGRGTQISFFQKKTNSCSCTGCALSDASSCGLDITHTNILSVILTQLKVVRQKLFGTRSIYTVLQ